MIEAAVNHIVLGELGFNILSTLKHSGFQNHALISDAWLPAYGVRFTQPTIYKLERVGHYCLEDVPEAVGTHVTAFLQQK
ncbi:hypothetical protein [Dyella acidisoli]|uniref:Alpha/beta hydrolase n=1 Tax=Dyella acidisoli TaxID=1867834 RepID=A0ABQ5XPK6_9GAMM|nr:hypothetical protein [Dyella acidisoli]GLQ92496.1 hypothetical protein GCM10007901_14470 [Dyella acidisoli]